MGVGGLGEDGREAWVVGEILRISGALEVAFSLEVVEEEEPVLRGGGAPPAKDLVRTFPRCLRMRTMGTASAAVVRPSYRERRAATVAWDSVSFHLLL